MHELPRLEDFRSTRQVTGSAELYNPPGLSNFLGCLQAARDVLAVQHVTFAPYSMGEAQLGTLALNDCCLHATGAPIAYVWQPDRIERATEHDGFAVSSVTVMGVNRQTVVCALRITNTAKVRRAAHLRIQTGEGVIHSLGGWKTPYSPRECPAISTTPWEGAPPESSLVRNLFRPIPEGDGILCTSRTSRAAAVQAASPAPDRIERRWLHFDWELGAGETRELHFFAAVGATPEDVLAEAAVWRSAPAAPITAAEADWREEIAAAFTPGNTRYSGHLPILETTNADLRRVYLAAIIGVIGHKRMHPDSRYGRTYVTIFPRYWVTSSFINDWSFTALLLIMLDPACVRRMVELWLERDIHRHFGTEYVSGDSTGNWYSCNDYAMTRLITLYVRVTGDQAWLDQRVGARSVLDHLRSFAAHYRSLDRGSGLADYGDRNSLLEAVGTYEHEVASLNAANVWILRELAALLEIRGAGAEAESFRAEAAALIPRIQQLYVNGGGYWQCRQRDGTLVPCRHAWDFVHVLNFLHEDLPAAQVREMVDFFARELWSPSWMAALSPLDEDAGFSMRLDHQWNGSWPGWVSFAASALLKIGRADLFEKWLPGLARSANQGPYSQAHFVENFAPPIDGGARKGPTEWPYINDWAVICAGNFFETVLLDLFRIDFGYTEFHAQPKLGPIDRTAALVNVPWHGRLHRINAAGVSHL
ncbi:MAG TPA: hypothetical protein VHE61_19510 [Opitutaceae bacterium]|nr:hypothetical protein [Opitutaceae bacterium]